MEQTRDPGTAILVCGDSDILADVSTALEIRGVEVVRVPDGQGAVRAARKRNPDYVVACHDLPDSTGIKVIQTVKRRSPLTMGVILGPRMSSKERRSMIAAGADDYIESDSGADRAATAMHRLIVRREIGILGRNEKILQAIETVESIAATKVTVLVTGESGTGKELIARAIHTRSDRKNGPFVAVNCGALPQGVLESELFGHEKGSFTGATAQRKGRFEIADGGTLLLDEVGEMPLVTQVRLLRVLEEERFMRVGGSQDVRVDVRLVASTNRDLRHLVSDGSFRQDLYYRLNVVAIHMPSLRERREDIRTIFLGATEEIRKKNQVKFGGVTDAALETLERYDWPGNVRELKNLAESLVVLSGGKRVDVDDLPDHIVKREQVHRDLPVRVGRPRAEVERDLLFGRLAEIETRVARLTDLVIDVRGILTGQPPSEAHPIVVPDEIKYTEIPAGSDETVLKAGTSIREMERELIEKTLRDVGGNRKKAAKLLGIGERTLYRRMREFGIR